MACDWCELDPWNAEEYLEQRMREPAYADEGLENFRCNTILQDATRTFLDAVEMAEGDQKAESILGALMTADDSIELEVKDEELQKKADELPVAAGHIKQLQDAIEAVQEILDGEGTDMLFRIRQLMEALFDRNNAGDKPFREAMAYSWDE